MTRPPGNRHPKCTSCTRRHRPDRDCTPVAAGAGDGVYHPAPFLKKYGG